jgi:hypothetical protein
MAWICEFNKDFDKADVGSAVAKFLGPNNEILFSYQKRLDGKAEALAFVAEAKAAKQVFDEAEAIDQQISDFITNKLNQE